MNDKACGSCHACCYVYGIEGRTFADGSPFPDKAQYELCRYHDGGCTVYENRPALCREYSCGWKATPSMPLKTRPDKAGFILASLEGEQDGRAGMIGILLYEVKHGRLQRAKRKLRDYFKAWQDAGILVGAIRHKGSKIDHVCGDRSVFTGEQVKVRS